MQVLYWGRALRTKEILPDFLKWRRVTRHPLVFRGLTVSQRTLGFGESQIWSHFGRPNRREREGRGKEKKKRREEEEDGGAKKVWNYDL